MLTSILSSDFSVVVNLAFRKGEPVDRHRRDNQATVIISGYLPVQSHSIVQLKISFQ